MGSARTDEELQAIVEESIAQIKRERDKQRRQYLENQKGVWGWVQRFIARLLMSKCS